MMGALVNSEFVGVDKDDQSGYATLMLVMLLTAPLGFSTLNLIPLKKEIAKAKKVRDKEDAKELKKSMKRKAQRLKAREANKAAMNEGGDQEPLLKNMLKI